MSNRVKSEIKHMATMAERTQRIDLGLAIAEHHARPGETMPYEVLAEFCGCTDPAIFLIEQKAIHTLRKRLVQYKDPLLQQLAEEFFFRRTAARARHTTEYS